MDAKAAVACWPADRLPIDMSVPSIGSRFAFPEETPFSSFEGFENFLRRLQDHQLVNGDGA
jgi:hypothetical protein